MSEAIHSDGIYETDLEADGSVIFLRPSPPPALFAKTAGQIASKPVWCGRPRAHARARMHAPLQSLQLHLPSAWGCQAGAAKPGWKLLTGAIWGGGLDAL